MPFLNVQFKLTPEQLEELAPIKRALSEAHGSHVLGEVFCRGYQYGTAKVYFLDPQAGKAVSDALVAAQGDYDKRTAKAERLKVLQGSFTGNATIDGDVLTVQQGAFKYELREIEE